jgi:ATP-binding cassette subfamily C (CFTR/MRP) protein 1
VTASAFELVAVIASALLSWIEDQRSIRPSDLMIIYFTVMGILSLPRARTLWMIPSSGPRSAIVYTLICVFIVLVLFFESVHKTGHLRTIHRRSSRETVSNFWVRSLFIWAIPLLRSGYSTILTVEDMPDIDTALEGTEAEKKLRVAWARGINILLDIPFA